MTPEISNFDKCTYTEWAGFLDDVGVFVDGEGFVRFATDIGTRVAVHDGVLCATQARDKSSLVTGGEDGKICRTNADGSHQVVHQSNANWIDRIATGPDSAIAYGCGRKGAVIFGSGKIQEIDVERSIEGLAFAPKGMRLAIARSDGVVLQWLNAGGSDQFLEWKGAHIGVIFSPDGKYVVSRMHENALHGWRLKDGKHMQMRGYPTKVTSTSWSYNGKWLATSSAPAAIVWPFSGRDGPMGKAPKELGGMGEIMVTQVCCHPTANMLAIGYENGLVMAASIDDEKVVSLRPDGDSAITALGWDRQGGRLAFGSESGEAGIIGFSA